MTDWRVECQVCETDYRKVHTELTDRDLAREGLQHVDAKILRCNNCRNLRTLSGGPIDPDDSADVGETGGVWR